jgi:hypothetical protein
MSVRAFLDQQNSARRWATLWAVLATMCCAIALWHYAIALATRIEEQRTLFNYTSDRTDSNTLPAVVNTKY